MDFNLGNIVNKLNNFTKDEANNLINELNNALANNNLNSENKVRLQEEKRDIVKKHGEIYEVKNRGVYKYSKESEYEILQKGMYNGEKNGYYKLDDNGNLKFDETLNKQIAKEINIAKSNLLKEQQQELNSFRKEGDTYIVDELGDDEKYIYLTRKSDGKEMQDFKISNELYNKIKENNKKGIESILKWNGKEYILI